MQNALLEEHTLPPFDDISLAAIKPAIEARIDNIWSVLKSQLAKIDAGEAPTWDNLVAPFEEASDLLSQSWSPVSHLNGVQNSDELREVYTECIQLLTEFSTAIDQHEPLYKAYQQLADSDGFSALSQAKQTVVNHALRDFRLAGVALPAAQKARSVMTYADDRALREQVYTAFATRASSGEWDNTALIDETLALRMWPCTIKTCNFLPLKKRAIPLPIFT